MSNKIVSGSLVSVVMPVFNGAAYLNEAVSSVLAQTHTNLEIILVDDGSTDNGVAHLEPDSRLCVFRQENSGPAAARNAGIAKSKGDFIALLDQDDRWLPKKLSVQLAAFDADPALSFCSTYLEFFLAPGVVPPSWLRDGSLDNSHAGFEPSTWLCRREMFERVGPFDASLRNGGDDSDWFHRAKTYGVKIGGVSETLVQKRIHEGNLSASLSFKKDLLKSASGWIQRHREAQKKSKISK